MHEYSNDFDIVLLSELNLFEKCQITSHEFISDFDIIGELFIFSMGKMIYILDSINFQNIKIEIEGTVTKIKAIQYENIILVICGYLNKKK